VNNRAAETIQLRRLQVKISALEARGGATLRGREEAQSGMESRVKESEEGLHQWFNVELPRLLTGLPLPEDSMATIFDNAREHPYSYSGDGKSGYSEDKGFNLSTGNYLSSTKHPINDRLNAVMGLDRSYAIAQTLCASKAAQATQDLRISSLLEKNSILKEHNLEMEGVLTRWEMDIEASSLACGDSREPFTSPTLGVGREEGPSSMTLEELRKREKALQEGQILQKRLNDYESEILELRFKLERFQGQVLEVNSLVDVLTHEEDVLKGESIRELSRLRAKFKGN
jgi:hypothetical protein